MNEFHFLIVQQLMIICLNLHLLCIYVTGVIPKDFQDCYTLGKINSSSVLKTNRVQISSNCD